MRACAACVLLFLTCDAAWAVRGVRISDLRNRPTPPNPVKVWGEVTSESPVRLSDGRRDIPVSGLTASLGDFVVAIGDWDGNTLNVTGATEGYVGPAHILMVWIPAGSFFMGNNGSEPYSYCDELPQHSVYVEGYWIGKYEVTRAQYRQFIDATGRAAPPYWAAVQNWGTGSFTQTDNHPVVGVSWFDADAFCVWAGGHLPTEAQWEKAGRWTGSYPNVFPWGNAWDVEKCNNLYDHSAAAGGLSKYQTAPVGSYPSGVSPYGLHDMSGNVWEWVQDWYITYPGSTCPRDKTGTARSVRGGGWNDYKDYTRCADRNGSAGSTPDSRYSYGGFRFAR